MMPRFPTGGVAALCLCLAGAAPAHAEPTYNFSPVNQYNLQVSAGFWNPIIQYVSSRSGVRLNLKLGRTSADTTSYVLAREVDFAFTNHLFSPERDKMVLDYQRRAGLTTETGNQLLSYPESTPPPGPGSAGELHGEHGGADPGADVERSAEGVDPDGPDETEDGDPAARGKKRDDKKGRSRDENERRDDDSHDGDEGGRK